MTQMIKTCLVNIAAVLWAHMQVWGVGFLIGVALVCVTALAILLAFFDLSMAMAILGEMLGVGRVTATMVMIVWWINEFFCWAGDDATYTSLFKYAHRDITKLLDRVGL